ncbi:hypothetical protein MMC22_000002 [Lobaria immixta]|nr:hypothetical protein [Lobaria immixta]
MARSQPANSQGRKPRDLRGIDLAVGRLNHGLINTLCVPPLDCRQAPLHECLRRVTLDLEDHCKPQALGYQLVIVKRGTRDIQCQISSETSSNDTVIQGWGESFGQAANPEAEYPGATLAAGRKRRSPSPELLSDHENDESDTPKDFPKDFQGTAIEDESVAVGDRDRITEIYHELLESIQQAPLKIILKEWIKLVQPGKQAANPYNGGKLQAEAIRKHGPKKKGEDTKPSWWPRDMNHVEPDHILKPARIKLAAHILRLPGLSSDDLRQSTNNLDITQKSKPEKKESVPRDLNELYDIRANEERLERGEIGKYTTMKKSLSILIKSLDYEATITFTPRRKQPVRKAQGAPKRSKGIPRQRKPAGISKRRGVTATPSNLGRQAATQSSSYGLNMPRSMPNSTDTSMINSWPLAWQLDVPLWEHAQNTVDCGICSMADNCQSAYDAGGLPTSMDVQTSVTPQTYPGWIQLEYSDDPLRCT